ncbi:hypothetical protein CSV67_14395 [Sporosarcina sp. P2]|nr:hypothetical protein CSV67_14395 [Sporosarcina sp. P2]
MKRGVHRIWWLRVFLIDVKWKGTFKRRAYRAVVTYHRALRTDYRAVTEHDRALVSYYRALYGDYRAVTHEL